MGTQRPRQRVRNFVSIADHKVAKATVPASAMLQFDGRDIRRTFQEGQWWFAVVDIIEALTDSVDPAQYIKKMRSRDEALHANWGIICTPLQMLARDGKQRKVHCAPAEGMFRIIQSVPSPKAEPLKRWFAEVAP